MQELSPITNGGKGGGGDGCAKNVVSYVHENAKLRIISKTLGLRSFQTELPTETEYIF